MKNSAALISTGRNYGEKLVAIIVVRLWEEYAIVTMMENRIKNHFTHYLSFVTQNFHLYICIYYRFPSAFPSPNSKAAFLSFIAVGLDRTSKRVLHHLKTKGIVLAHGTSSCCRVTDGIIVGTATSMILTADGVL